jgi:AAA domain-containing protein
MKIEVASLSQIDALNWDIKDPSGQTGTAMNVVDVPSIFTFKETGIQWAVDGFIAMSAVTMISGDPGLLKTTLATAIGRAVAHGSEFAGAPTSQREVLQLDRENSLAVTQDRFRRLRIIDGEGFRIWGGWVGDVPSAGSGTILEYAAAANPKPLIIEDSLIASLNGNENDAAVIRAYMGSHRKLAELGCAVLILHHAGKADSARKYRGSSDILAAVDVAYEVEGLGDPTRLDRLRLKAFKSRFATRQAITLGFDGRVFFPDEPPSLITKSNTERLKELLIANPGIKADDFSKLAVRENLGRDPAREFLDQCKRLGSVQVTPGKNNAQFHTWIGSAKDGQLP